MSNFGWQFWEIFTNTLSKTNHNLNSGQSKYQKFVFDFELRFQNVLGFIILGCYKEIDPFDSICAKNCVMANSFSHEKV